MNTKFSSSSSGSNLSLDSLEIDFKKNKTTESHRNENTETVLVPFYEKDVLMKIPKGPMKNFLIKTQKSCKNKMNNDTEKESISYLVNKNLRQSRRTSYLEIFRKKFATHCAPCNNDTEEIRSLSPEFGDTERDNFSDDANTPTKDFYDTEAYNDIYYEKIMNQEITQFLNKNFEQALKFTEDIKSKSDEDITKNLKSVSEVSQPRRHARRATIEPVQNIRLGGLGPDIENIKPRLERARSLQRYSEKVRMENRLKIYKKSIQDDKDKITRESSAKQRNEDNKNKHKTAQSDSSYLVNKSSPDKKVQKALNSKSKSAEVSNDWKCNKIFAKNVKANNEVDKLLKSSRDTKTTIKPDAEVLGHAPRDKIKLRVQSSRNAKRTETKYDTNRNIEDSVKINYTLNVGTLKSLEEKHRMYQEKVKQFRMEDF